jgi:glutamyl-tRNA synthetase
VLIRADSTFLYTFTSVVDDVDFGITHVIRGEDHVTNTGIQIQLFQAMGATPPHFAHHSLLVGADGHALSKRDRGLSIEAMREDGLEALAICSYAALVGTSEAIEPHLEMQSLADRLDLSRLSRAPGRFDPAELRTLNARTLHLLPYERVAERLAALGVGGGAPFWAAVRGNLERLADAALWWRVVTGTIEPRIEDAGFCRKAAELLPPEPWSDGTWSEWTGAVKSATGAKGRALFHPLRLALTGLEQGPELKALLPLIGRDVAYARLTAAT